MKILRLILPNHLSKDVISLKDCSKDDLILICEAVEFFTNVPHHPKKIAFQMASMRHFAEVLRAQEYNVRYIPIDDNLELIDDAIIKDEFDKLLVAEPGDYDLHQRLCKLGFDVLEDDRFLCKRDEFNLWANGKKQLRMEFFYREMRKKHDILMDNGSPVGYKWNYDSENREDYRNRLTIPTRINHLESEIVSEVIEIVRQRFGHHFGDLESFDFAVTREDAMAEVIHFMVEILPYFGKYQDVMAVDQVYLYHSRLSTYLNSGLILPLELCKLAEKQYRNGRASLPAVEGFIRQVLGWREYIRGIYWRLMPRYCELNFFDAKRPLPAFFWGSKTQMKCISEVVQQTKNHAYSHHIQRLMITGNFALLAGLDVVEVQEWYLVVYADAYEWVEMPNTLGMALFGDGGVVASKPYAASGNYISKMSNFCANCHYNHKQLSGEKACPFNSLYWNFFLVHRDKLEQNPRLSFVYKNLDKFPQEKKKSITERANYIINNLELI